MTIWLIVAFVGLLLVAWFIYNHKVKVGGTSTTDYSRTRTYRYDTVRDL